MDINFETFALPWVAYRDHDHRRMSERVTIQQLPPLSVREAWCKWFRFHGINPVDVPIPGWIERDVTGCCVRYLALKRDGDGNILWTSRKVTDNITAHSPVLVERVSQGEGPPLPFPELHTDGWRQPAQFGLHTMGVDC